MASTRSCTLITLNYNVSNQLFLIEKFWNIRNSLLKPSTDKKNKQALF